MSTVIYCDCCDCNMTMFKNVGEITNETANLLRTYSNLRYPDLCINCVKDLIEQVREAVIQWKLKGGKK
jgi:hypothetical protein